MLRFKEFRIIGYVLLILLIVSGCGSGGGGGTVSTTTITGSVVFNETKINGAVVRLFKSGILEHVKEDTTDAEGKFEFAGVTAGYYYIEINNVNGVEPYKTIFYYPIENMINLSIIVSQTYNYDIFYNEIDDLPPGPPEV